MKWMILLVPLLAKDERGNDERRRQADEVEERVQRVISRLAGLGVVVQPEAQTPDRDASDSTCFP